jgi:hypothetical protein
VKRGTALRDQITTSSQDIKERLSMAYLVMVAAASGCEVRPVAVDREGIDATVCPIRGIRSKLDVQLKATSHPTWVAGGNALSVSMARPTVERLRNGPRLFPAMLVVLVLPEKEDQWLSIEDGRTCLSASAYWTDFAAVEEGDTCPDGATMAIRVDRSRLFTPAVIRDTLIAVHARAKAADSDGPYPVGGRQ